MARLVTNSVWSTCSGTTKRMESIIGAERERVLKKERVVYLRMNLELKRDGRAKFRCIVMGHTEPREWSEEAQIHQ